MRVQTKLLLVILSGFSISTLADPQCASVWAYKPWKACLEKPDLTAKGTVLPPIETEVGFDNGGAGRGEAMCQSAIDRFNARAENVKNGLSAVGSVFLRSHSHREGPFVKYSYDCMLQIKQFPIVKVPDKSCGTEDSWSYDNTHPKPQIQGDAVCLSCDTAAQESNATALASCLKQNIDQIIIPKAIDLRPDDEKAVLNNVNKVLRIQQRRPFLSANDEIFFDEWAKKTTTQLNNSSTEQQNPVPSDIRQKPLAQ